MNDSILLLVQAVFDSTLLVQQDWISLIKTEKTGHLLSTIL